MSFEPRPYQIAAVDSVSLAFAKRFRRVMLAASTGSGKTECAMMMIRRAMAKGKRVTFLANRIHLVEQTSRRLTAAGIEHGVIQSANTARTYMPVLVASIQTVAKRGMDACDLLIIDEGHAVAGSKEFRTIVMAHKGHCVALSATPWSKGLGKHYDELGGALFDHLVVATTVPELIEQGYLVDADVYAPSEPDLSKVKIVAGDYHEGQLGEAVDKPELIGDIVLTWLKLAGGAPTVCFATNIAHSKHIVKEFVEAGVKAEHIDCHTSDKDRQAMLARIASGETTVISNVGILCEGWDFPACKVMILARPTKSMIRYMQMAGRVLRPAEGKLKATILDHSGTCKRLGFPTDHHEFDLDDGKPKKASDPKPKPEPLPKPCPVCHFMKAAKVYTCPACGFTPERQSQVEVADGELTLLKRSKTAEQRHQVRKGLDEFGSKQSVYSQLLGIARSKAYKDGWAANKYRVVFGVWPRGLSETTEPVGPRVQQFLRAEAIRFSYAKKNDRGSHAAA